MKKVHTIHIVTSLVFVGFLYGIVNLKQGTKVEIIPQEAHLQTTGAVTKIKMNVFAKDANEFPVEISVIGYNSKHQEAEQFLRESAHRYAQARTTSEILTDFPDGVIRLTFFVPTMPLLTVDLLQKHRIIGSSHKEI